MVWIYFFIAILAKYYLVVFRCHLAQWTYGKDRAQSKDDGWRPVLVITDISEEKMDENVQQIRDFVMRNQIRVINVAGHRETTSGESGFTEKVRALLVKAFAGLDNLQSSLI